MRAYHDLLLEIINNGNDRSDRTGTGTRSCFGLHFRHNLAEGFPLLTTKRLPWKSIVVELLWFLKGDTNIRYLLENGVHIWTADAYRHYINQFAAKEAKRAAYSIEDYKEDMKDPTFARQWGDLGPIYGAQWRQWVAWTTINQDPGGNRYGESETIDQIKGVINSIKMNPEGRRHIVTAWNPSEVDNMALPPCHCMFQFYVSDSRLSCHMYQRSADVFLGVPFNIASYGLLTHIIAHQCGLGVGELIVSFGDVHIYNNHRAQVELQLSREPKPLPTLEIFMGPNEPRIPAIDEYEPHNFMIHDYDPWPAIRGELSVGV